MSTEHFDLLVVGGGKGGKTLAARLAREGRRVAMVERGMIGGSCINVACIPTKTLVRSAKVADLARRAARHGIRIEVAPVDAVAVRARKREVVAEMVARNRKAFDDSGLELILGTARFVAPKTVAVRLAGGGERTLFGEQVVVNTGTRPSAPDVPGLAAAGALDSESIQELDRIPERLVVLGGGVIGCELGQVFARFGSRVVIVDRNERLMPREEPEVVEELRHAFDEDGIEVVTGASVSEVAGRSGSEVRVRVRSGAGERTIEGTHLLVALGRVPNTDGLDAASAGIELDERGFVRVNDRLETTAPDTWAVGDVNGGPQFTHVSLDDHRIVAANLAGGDRRTKGRVVPYTIFTDPELGRVGHTEESARRAGFAVRTASLPAAAIPRCVTSGEMRGLWKAVVEQGSDRILGVSILGAEGGEVMAVVQVAMQAGLGASALRDAILAHPTMAEGLNDLFARLPA